MTFKIHAVYKQASQIQKPQAEEVKSNEETNPQDLSLSSTGSKTTQKSLQQQRADVLNSRSSVKPGTKIAIKKSTYEGGLEADMY